MSMTEKEFTSALRRGLGSAILELKNNENRTAYRDIVMRYCLRDISYDWQVEGTKGVYLYSAICALGEKDNFEPILIERFLSRCPDKLSLQLSGVLGCYADDGSVIAKDAFRKKYDYFAAKRGRLSHNPSKDIDEGLQWDDVADFLFHIDGFAAFKRYAQDAGECLSKNIDNRNIYYDYLTNRAKEIFGENRVNNYIDKMYEKSDAIKTLVDTLKADEQSRKEYQTKHIQEHTTVQAVFHAAKEAALNIRPRFKMVRYRHMFMKNASEGEVLELAQTALNEEDETVKALLLLMFSRKSFPLDIVPLIEYASSNNELLAEVSITVLEEVKDKRVHDLAIRLLEQKGLKSSALGLLKKNYKKPDDKLIGSLIKKSGNIPHHVQMDIREIYLRHRSKDAFPILHRVYQKGECSFCRSGIVEAMKHCGVLPDDILIECLYDSYEGTRRYVKRVLANRNRRKIE